MSNFTKLINIKKELDIMSSIDGQLEQGDINEVAIYHGEYSSMVNSENNSVQWDYQPTLWEQEIITKYKGNYSI